MSSMYETIMELPLFKGIGEEQLSHMLEKTCVNFKKYEGGEEIAKARDNVKNVDFILSGKVKVLYKMSHYPVEVEEILGKGSILGARHLFGMDTTYCGDLLAMTKVSLMRIDKSEYMNILQSDRIYMLNYVNYISAALQRCPSYLMESDDDPISRALILLGLSMTSRMAEMIKLKASKTAFATYCGVEDKEFLQWESRMSGLHRFQISEEGILINPRPIPSL